MNYKKYLLALALIVCFQGSSAKANTLVVTIDGEKIVKTSNPGKELHKRLTSKQEKLAAPLKKKEQEIKKLQAEFEAAKKSFEKAVMKFQGKEAELLSADAKEKKAESLQQEQQKLEEMQVRIQQKVKQFQEDAKRIEQKIGYEYQKEMDVFDKQIKQVIETAAAREKWDIVLMQFVYADPSTDKTQVIINDLNKLHASSSPKAPAAKRQKAA